MLTTRVKRILDTKSRSTHDTESGHNLSSLSVEIQSQPEKDTRYAVSVIRKLTTER